MRPLLNPSAYKAVISPRCVWCSFNVRSLSTKSAIERGIRRSRQPTRSAHGEESRSRRRENDARTAGLARVRQEDTRYHSRGGPPRMRSSPYPAGLKHSKATSSGRRNGVEMRGERTTTRSTERSNSVAAYDATRFSSIQIRTPKTNQSAERPQRQREPRSDTVTAPSSVPYTTAASEYLYGTSVVEAALASNRRKLYKLFVYTGGQGIRNEQSNQITRLAANKGVAIERVFGSSWSTLMDKMSSGRPHNGYCMEVSRLQRPTVKKLLRCSRNAGNLPIGFSYETGTMSREDREIDGSSNHIEISTTIPRQPLVLLLDGVVDTGNLGGILRSALFLGADAVAISSSCGPLNPVVLKASAGAAESLPLLFVSDTTGFIEGSKASGWKIFGSVAPPKPSKRRSRANTQPHFGLEDLGSPLKEHPCILMIGGEGSGLKADLQRRAEYTVSISSGSSVSNFVDSLNVSVATGILLERFLRTDPAPAAESQSKLW